LIIDGLITVKEAREMDSIERLKYGFDPYRQVYTRQLCDGTTMAYQHISK
jgi:hypothetical protein